jgi:RNA polymerase sigma factor (sigma-70 family)
MEIGYTLINNCQKGDRASENSLFRLLYAPMFRLCLRYTGKQAEAEDCLMKGFIQVFRALPAFQYNGDGAFISWVKKIMVNEVLGFLRRQQPLLYAQETAEEITIEPVALDRIAAEELFALVAGLPNGYRLVINLYIIEGYSHAEIAALLGISEATSRTQLAKAKAKLRTLIEQKNAYYGVER